jgi:hypothetical protein
MTKEEQIDAFFIDHVFPHLSLTDTVKASLVSKRFYQYAVADAKGKFILKKDGYKWNPKDDVTIRVHQGMSVDICLAGGEKEETSSFVPLKFTFTGPVHCGPIFVYSEVFIEESKKDIDNAKEYLWVFGSPPPDAIRKTCDMRLFNIFKKQENEVRKTYWWYTLSPPYTPKSAQELVEKILKCSKVERKQDSE